MEPLYRIRIVLGSVIWVLLVGTIGYHVVEGWSFFDALYMTTITLATIGYGEVHPLSTSGRVFTIFLSLTGLGVMAYSFSTITAFVVEGQLTHALRRRKMDARIKKLDGHYIVCGAGYTGESICEELQKTRREFVVIDKDPEVCAKHQERGWLVVQGNALQDEVLEKAGIKKAKGICCALDDDPDNMFITISARALNPRMRVVSEVHDDDVKDRLLRSGADAVVSSMSIGGLRMASQMVRPAAVNFLDSMIRDPKSTYRFEEISIPEGSAFAGKPLKSIQETNGRAPLIVAIRPSSASSYTIGPSADHELSAGDVLVVIGEVDAVRELQESAKG